MEKRPREMKGDSTGIAPIQVRRKKEERKRKKKKRKRGRKRELREEKECIQGRRKRMAMEEIMMMTPASL